MYAPKLHVKQYDYSHKEIYTLTRKITCAKWIIIATQNAHEKALKLQRLEICHQGKLNPDKLTVMSGRGLKARARTRDP